MNNRTRPLTKEMSNAYYPWIVIAFCSLFLLLKYSLQVSPSVMADQLMRTFHLNALGLGNLAATYFYAYLIFQLMAGPLLDKFNAKRLMSLAILLCALGTLLFARTSELWVAEVARSLIGAGAAFATIGYMKMAALWFKPERFALVGGLLTAGVMVGAMLGQAPLSLLIEHTGWRQALVILAVIGLIIGILFFIFVKHRDKNPHLVLNEKKAINLADFLNLLRKKSNWLLTFYSGLAFAPLAVFGGLWGVTFLQTAYHFSHNVAAGTCSLVFLGFGIGGPLFGYIAIRIRNKFRTMVIGLWLALLTIIIVVYIPGLPVWLLDMTLILFGLGTGAYMLGFAEGKDINHALLAASIIGMINTGDAIFGAFSEPLVGKLLDMAWKGGSLAGAHVFSLHAYHLAFLIYPIYLLLAWVCLLIYKRT